MIAYVLTLPFQSFNQLAWVGRDWPRLRSAHYQWKALRNVIAALGRDARPSPDLEHVQLAASRVAGRLGGEVKHRRVCAVEALPPARVGPDSAGVIWTFEGSPVVEVCGRNIRSRMSPAERWDLTVRVEPTCPSEDVNAGVLFLANWIGQDVKSAKKLVDVSFGHADRVEVTADLVLAVLSLAAAGQSDLAMVLWDSRLEGIDLFTKRR